MSTAVQAGAKPASLLLYIVIDPQIQDRLQDKFRAPTVQIAIEMMHDLLCSSGMQAERLPPSVVYGYLSDLEEAITIFHRMRRLLSGLETALTNDRIRTLAILMNTDETPSLLPYNELRCQFSDPLPTDWEGSKFFATRSAYMASRKPGGPDLMKRHKAGDSEYQSVYEFVPNSSWNAPGDKKNHVSGAEHSAPSLKLRVELALNGLSQGALSVALRKPSVVIPVFWLSVASIPLVTTIILIRTSQHPIKEAIRPSQNPQVQQVIDEPMKKTPEPVDRHTVVLPAAALEKSLSPKASQKDRSQLDVVVVEKTDSHLDIFLSPEERKRLVTTADHLSGDGKYDEAIRIYRMVLRKDPQNGDALEGLHRAEQNKAQ